MFLPEELISWNLTVGFKSKMHIFPDRMTFLTESILVPYRCPSYSPHSTYFPSSISFCISILDTKKYPLPFSSPAFLGRLVSEQKKIHFKHFYIMRYSWEIQLVRNTTNCRKLLFFISFTCIATCKWKKYIIYYILLFFHGTWWWVKLETLFIFEFLVHCRIFLNHLLFQSYQRRTTCKTTFLFI